MRTKIIETVDCPETTIQTPLDIEQLLNPTKRVYKLNPLDEKLTVDTYSRRATATRLQALAEDLLLQEAVNWVFSRVRKYGSASLRSLYQYATVERTYIDKAVLWLLNSKIVTTETCREGELTLVLGAESPPEVNEHNLDLYMVDIGAIYWIAEHPLEGDDLVKAIATQILETEGGVEAAEDLEGLLKQMDDIYGLDEAGGLISKDIRTISDREEGIRYTVTLDDGGGVLPLWTVYCQQTEPGIIACSEW